MAKFKREKCNYLNFTFTIFEKYDTWQLSFKNPEDGKIIKRSTKLDANTTNLQIVKKEIIPSLVEYLTGQQQIVDENEIKEYKVGEFADIHFSLYKERVREHTGERNEDHYNNHIKKPFANRTFSSIKPMELEKWQNDFKKRGYATSSIKKFRSVFYTIFTEAIKNGIIDVNPFSKVPAPKIEKKFLLAEDDEDEVFPFSKAEMDTILKNCNGYLKNYFMLMYATGIRPGELIALMWKDIDFQKKQIHVYKTITKSKIGPPKTSSSVRKVDMLALAEFALVEQYKITYAHQFVFVNKYNRNFYSQDYIGAQFMKILSDNNIQARSLYNLRHTFASQLISQGEDIVWVSKTLGHANLSITLQYYTKYIKEDEETRLKKISDIGAIFGANILTELSKADK